MNLALGLPRLPRAARRQLASREALHAWWPDLQGPMSGAALARFSVARLSEWLPLPVWAVVVAGPDGLDVLAGARRRGRFAHAATTAAAAALAAQAHWSAGSMRASLGVGPDAVAVAWVLRSREGVIGVLVGIDDAPAPRPPDVSGVGERLQQDVLGPIALALARVRQLDRLKELVSIDDLTGLFNARHLHHTVKLELSRLTRTGRPLATSSWWCCPGRVSAMPAAWPAAFSNASQRRRSCRSGDRTCA